MYVHTWHWLVSGEALTYDHATARFTDIGLPENATRDGTLNTNNWIERCFRTFDQVFLDCRANKR